MTSRGTDGCNQHPFSTRPSRQAVGRGHTGSARLMTCVGPLGIDRDRGEDP
jgi:hypothetical protein